VAGGGDDGDGAENGGELALVFAGQNDGADHGDGVERVGEGHQRGVQQWGNAANDFKSDESGEHENVKAGDQVQLHLCPSFGGQGWQLEKFAEAGVDHFAGLREQRVANDFVGGVELQLAIFDEVDEEGGKVARIHLTRVIRHGAGEIEPADDGDAVDVDFFSGLGELAIAAAFRSEIDDYRARRHARDHFLGDQHRRGFAGNHRGSDDHVAFGHHCAEQFALAAVKIFALRARV